jgi:hypothetical protein
VASKTSIEIGLLLAAYLHNVETLLCACSSTYRHSLHLHKHACLLVILVQDVPQTLIRNKLYCVCANDQHYQSGLQSHLRRLLVSTLSL